MSWTAQVCHRPATNNAEKGFAVKLMYLLRHAKSSWDDPSIDDFDRPLNKRGRKAATLLATYFQSQNIRPDTILCSPSKRTRQTLENLQPVLGNVEATFDRRLYEASQHTIYAFLSELPNRSRSILLIGHNPGLQRTALCLAKATPHTPMLQLLDDKFPTGSLATLSAKIDDWSQLSPGGCVLENIIRVSDLGDA